MRITVISAVPPFHLSDTKQTALNEATIADRSSKIDLHPHFGEEVCVESENWTGVSVNNRNEAW